MVLTDLRFSPHRKIEVPLRRMSILVPFLSKTSAPGRLFNWQVFIALLIWIYLLYRAFTLSVTQDEAYSYFLAKTDYWKAMPGSANTHWLNTLSMRLFLLLPGEDAPWKLRMLSVLSWPLYAYSVARLSGLLKNRWLSMSCFLVMILNPFLLFFFSLGRGYAAASAFIAFSLWLMSKKIANGGILTRQWQPVFVSACLAVICNFTSLYFLLAICIVYAFFLNREKSFKSLLQRDARPAVHIVTATIVFSAASLLFIDLYSGDLEHGGRSNLPRSLFGSLLANSVYVKLPALLKQAFGISVVVFLTGAGLFSLYKLRAEKKYHATSFFLLTLLMIVLLNWIFHVAAGIPYLLDRTTLIIFPLLTISLFLLMQSILKKMPGLVRSTIAVLIIVLTGINFYKSFSLQYFKEWPMQQYSIKAYDWLQQQNARHVAMDVWQYSVMHNYYRHAYPGRYEFVYSMVNYRHLTDTTGRSMINFDYLLLSQPYQKKENILATWFVKIHDPATGITLLANPSRNSSLPKK